MCARASHAKAHSHRFQHDVRRRLGVRVCQGTWTGQLRLRHCRQAQAHGQEMRYQEDREHRYKGEWVQVISALGNALMRAQVPSSLRNR